MKYPLLTKMIHKLADQDGMDELPESEWQWPHNAQDLENQANSLSEEQRQTLIEGEYTELKQLLGVKELSDFINEIFDGDLHNNFYEE